MKRKLAILNVVLAVLVGVSGWRLRQDWLAAHQHEAAVLKARIPPAAPPPYTPLAPPQPVVPAQYIDIAGKDLFTKERNPVVVIEKPAPPPPPPMPPLPVLRGMLNLDGMSAIMSESPKTAPKEVRPGEQVGQFKLLAVNSQEVVLEWNGQQVKRKPEELMDHTIPEAPAQGQAAANAPAAQAAPPPPVQKAGPGADIGQGRKLCVPGVDDAHSGSPVGTVVDGLKKVTFSTPFGEACAWEPVK